jgi:hypothetical protein
MNTAELQFNIIYTPYTARSLSMFIPSLLEFMDCRFRIIANGCLPDEVQILRNICAQHERLEFLMLSEDGMMPHGYALNWLHERTEGPWFCYMDSDVIATGPFIDSVAAQLDNSDVFSSCLPLWHAPEDAVLPAAFRRMQGSHIWTDDGVCIGCDYFAVFNNELLTKIMKANDIGFQTYRWDDIPAKQQALLRKMRMDKTDYDSGKVLTALLLHEGARYSYEDIPNLRHLGGFSANAGDGKTFDYRGGFDRLAVNFANGLLATPLLYLADLWYGIRRTAPGLTREEHDALPLAEKRILQSRIRKRRNTARYFYVMMRALLEGTKPPGQPILGHRPAEERLVDTAACIKEIIARHHAGELHKT